MWLSSKQSHLSRSNSESLWRMCACNQLSWGYAIEWCEQILVYHVWLLSKELFQQRIEICPGYGLYASANPGKLLSFWGSLNKVMQSVLPIVLAILHGWWLEQVTSHPTHNARNYGFSPWSRRPLARPLWNAARRGIWLGYHQSLCIHRISLKSILKNTKFV